MKKLLAFTSLLAILAGFAMIVGGTWGIWFTYKNIVQEKITTPSDASLPGQPVVGPFTLMAQSEIIREHTLESTGGKVFAEMPRQVAKLDANGREVKGADGKTVMVANTARDIWITATALTTALHLGIITYAFSGLILFFGFVSVWTGIAFRALSKRY